MFLCTKKLVFCKIVTKSEFVTKSGVHCNSIDLSLLDEEVKCPTMNQDLYGNDIGWHKNVSSWQECGKLFFQK